MTATRSDAMDRNPDEEKPEMTTTTHTDPAAGFPALPESLKVANRPALGGTPQTLKMIKEAAMAKTTGDVKMGQLRALREARAAEAEAKAKDNPAGRDPASLAARERVKADQKAKNAAKGPQRKPLTFVDGRAKAKHAHYDVQIDDTGETRQFIVTATTADGTGRVGEYESAQAARDGAADHHHGLALNGAPIYKPAKTQIVQQESDMAAKAKKKAKAPKKAKAAKAKPAKKAKAAAKANARKPVKGKTAARKPREAGAPTKAESTIAKLKKGWTSSTALQTELGWLPHTLRGFLSGLRTKQGMTIETDRREDGTHYRIAK